MSPFTPPGGNNKTPPEALNRAGRAAGLYGGAQDRVKTRSWGLVTVGDSMYTYQ
jgi:GTP cyclohydrolase III